MKLRSLNDESARTGIRVRHFEKKKPSDSRYSDIDELNEYMEESLKEPPHVIKQLPIQSPPNPSSRSKQAADEAVRMAPNMFRPPAPVQHNLQQNMQIIGVPQPKINQMPPRTEIRQPQPQKPMPQANILFPPQPQQIHQIMIQNSIQKAQQPTTTGQSQQKVVVQMPHTQIPQSSALQNLLRQPQHAETLPQLAVSKPQQPRIEEVNFRIQPEPVPLSSSKANQSNPMFMTLGAPQTVPQGVPQQPPQPMTQAPKVPQSQPSQVSDFSLNDTLNDPKILLQVENMQRQIQMLTKVLEEKESRERVNDRRLEDIIRVKDQEIAYKDQEIKRYLGIIEELTQDTAIKHTEMDMMRQELHRERQNKQKLEQSLQSMISQRPPQQPQQELPLRNWQNVPKKQKEIEIRKAQQQQQQQERNAATNAFKKKSQGQAKKPESFTPTFEVKWGSPSQPPAAQMTQFKAEEQFLSPLSVSMNSTKQNLFIEDSKQFRFEDLKDMSDLY